MKTADMVQCVLTRKHNTPDGDVFETQIAWIEKRFAEPGKLLDLKTDHGSWSHDWTVQAAYIDASMAYSEVRERSQDYKKLPSLKTSITD
jgi:hypothetical protein